MRAGIAAFMAYLALGVIGAALQFADIDTLIRSVDASAGSTVPADVARTAVIAGIAIGLVVVCFEGLCIWFAWQGRNWARIVLLVLAGLTIVFGMAGFGGYSPVPGFVRGLSFCQWVLAVAGIVLLSMRPSIEWFRYRRWLRQAGLPG